MRKLLVIARHEYLHHLRRKGFLFATFGLPAVLIGLFGLVVLLLIQAESLTALGYVDHAGLLSDLPPQTTVAGDPGPAVPAIRYPDEQSARQALEDGEINVYFVVSADYLASGEVAAYAWRHIPELGKERFERLLKTALLARVPGDNPRLAEPIAEAEVLTAEGQPTNPVVSFLVPMLYGILLMISSFTSSGYLMQSLVEEKENRLMEILATSLRPAVLMGGKILGLGLLGMSQFLIWVGSGALALLAAASLLELPGLGIPLDTLLLLAVLFVPSYLLFAATLSTIGAAVTATQEGQQVASIVSMLGMSPVWFMAILVQKPSGIVALALSFFPYTAPVTLLLRRALGTVPGWQVALSLLILSAAALGMVWCAGRVLRYGMLRYGQRIGLRELGRVLRGV